jgi:hypothetical protein
MIFLYDWHLLPGFPAYAVWFTMEGLMTLVRTALYSSFAVASIALTTATCWAQQLPELPPPRPVQPVPAKPLPARPNPAQPVPPPGPSPLLVRLAAESNLYAPCCEPAGATHGLWPHKIPLHNCQEYWMCYRDFLTWCYTRPTCCCGLQPPTDASIVDWTLHWLKGRNRPLARPNCTTCPVRTLPPTFQARRD